MPGPGLIARSGRAREHRLLSTGSGFQSVARDGHGGPQQVDIGQDGPESGEQRPGSSWAEDRVCSGGSLLVQPSQKPSPWNSHFSRPLLNGVASH